MVRGNEARDKSRRAARPNTTANAASIAGATAQALPVLGETAAMTPCMAVSIANTNDALESAAVIQSNCRERLASKKVTLLKFPTNLLRFSMWPNHTA